MGVVAAWARTRNCRAAGGAVRGGHPRVLLPRDGVVQLATQLAAALEAVLASAAAANYKPGHGQPAAHPVARVVF